MGECGKLGFPQRRVYVGQTRAVNHLLAGCLTDGRTDGGRLHRCESFKRDINAPSQNTRFVHHVSQQASPNPFLAPPANVSSVFDMMVSLSGWLAAGTRTFPLGGGEMGGAPFFWGLWPFSLCFCTVWLMSLGCGPMAGKKMMGRPQGGFQGEVFQRGLGRMDGW